jgi:hypothetical protein
LTSAAIFLTFAASDGGPAHNIGDFSPLARPGRGGWVRLRVNYAARVGRTVMANGTVIPLRGVGLTGAMIHPQIISI